MDLHNYANLQPFKRQRKGHALTHVQLRLAKNSTLAYLYHARTRPSATCSLCINTPQVGAAELLKLPTQANYTRAKDSIGGLALCVPCLWSKLSSQAWHSVCHADAKVQSLRGTRCKLQTARHRATCVWQLLSKLQSTRQHPAVPVALNPHCRHPATTISQTTDGDYCPIAFNRASAAAASLARMSSVPGAGAAALLEAAAPPTFWPVPVLEDAFSFSLQQK